MDAVERKRVRDREVNYARYHRDAIYRMKTQLRSLRSHYSNQLVANRQHMHVLPYRWGEGRASEAPKIDCGPCDNGVLRPPDQGAAPLGEP